MRKIYPEIIMTLKTIAYAITIGSIILVYKHQNEDIPTTSASQNKPPPKRQDIAEDPTKSNTQWSGWNQDHVLKTIEADLLSPPITISELVLIVKGNEEKTLIIDARDKIFYERGHIPKSINMTMEDFTKDTKHFSDLMAKYQQIIIYCTNRNCRDSKNLRSKLNEYKIKNIRIFEGGFQEWKETQEIAKGRGIGLDQ